MDAQRTPEDLTMRWWPIGESRPSGGRYVLVSNNMTKTVGFARYKPAKSVWVFPSAAMAFEVTHFMYLPEAAQ